MNMKYAAGLFVMVMMSAVFYFWREPPPDKPSISIQTVRKHSEQNNHKPVKFRENQVFEQRIFSSSDMEEQTYRKWLEKEKRYNQPLLAALLLTRFDENRDGKLSMTEVDSIISKLGKDFTGNAWSYPSDDEQSASITESGQPVTADAMRKEFKEKEEPYIFFVIPTAGSFFFSRKEGGTLEQTKSPPVKGMEISTFEKEAVQSNESRRSLETLYNRFNYNQENGFPAGQREAMLEYMIDHYFETAPLFGDQTISFQNDGLNL